jgi:hypothetical protein
MNNQQGVVELQKRRDGGVNATVLVRGADSEDLAAFMERVAIMLIEGKSKGEGQKSNRHDKM